MEAAPEGAQRASGRMRLGFVIAGALIVLSTAGATVGIGMMQVKHIANMNQLFWSTVLGETPAVTPAMIVANGPDSIRTKAELVAYLKDSYAIGHRAARSLTAENCTDGVMVDEGNTGPRLFWMTFALSHAYGHYGQLVVYLRMHDLVPPSHEDGD